ncbi:MAG: hypothetical protein ABH835_02785 [Patescibacteria group bacterium]|nr:hypothetical protein [Patescibacteria group bacterium]
MEYGNIIKRSFHITFKNKVLWIFGMLVVSGGGGSFMGNSGSSFQQIGTEMDSNQMSDAFNEVSNFLSTYWQILLFVGIGLLLICLIAMILSIIAQGGLYKGANTASQGVKVKFGEHFKFGLEKFWRVLGINILLVLIMLGGILAGFIVLIPFLLLMVIPIIGWIVGFLAIFLLVIAFILFVVGISLFVNYIYCYALIEDNKIKESFKKAWHLLRANFGESLVMGIILFGITFLIAIVALLIIFTLLLVFGIIGYILYESAGLTALLILIAIGLLIMFVIGLFIKGIRNTYIFSAWVLTWQELSGKNSRETANEKTVLKKKKKTAKPKTKKKKATTKKPTKK